MKKILIRLLALALAACLVLALGACGGRKEGNSAPDNSKTESTPASSAVADNGPNADGKYANVAALVNSDEMQSQLESMKDQFGDTGASLDITGEGNKLIYTFTYADLGDQDAETIATALETAMEQMASVFETIASSLSTQVEAANPTVVVTYKANDGTELFSKEYSGK